MWFKVYNNVILLCTIWVNLQNKDVNSNSSYNVGIIYNIIDLTLKEKKKCKQFKTVERFFPLNNVTKRNSYIT